MLLTDNVLNHWKNNIVHLDMLISGSEIFLLDPNLEMPQLKSLSVSSERSFTFNRAKNCDTDKVKERDISRVVNHLLEKHKHTLEKLDLKFFRIVLSNLILFVFISLGL